MKISKVAERYARSLFGLALEQNGLDEVYADVARLQQVCESSKEFRLFLKSPVIHTDKKLAILNEMFGKDFRKITMGFIAILVRKNRESLLQEIAVSFIELYKDHKNILTVHFRSAVSPTDAVRKQVEEIMKKYSGSSIELVEITDPSVIGGFQLSWKDMQYDATISHQVEKLKRGVGRVNLYVKEM